MVSFLIMFFSLESDVINKAIAQDNIALDVIRQCVYTFRKGKHIVDMSIPDANKLIQAKDLFSRYELAVFDQIRKNHVTLNNVKQKLVITACVTFQDTTRRVNNVIFINPLKTSSFEFLEETHLLTENLEDSNFFLEFVIPYYQRKEKILKSKVCAYRLMGGGDTTAKVMAYEIENEQHFILSVTDSDYTYQGDAHLGNTASKVKSCLKKNPFNADLYIMEQVREVENLIPYACLKNNPHQKNHFLFKGNHSCNLSFFDMKEGLYIKKLFQHNVYLYWANNLSNFNLGSKFCLINRKKNLSQTKFENYFRDILLIPGFGSNILEDSISQLPKCLPIITDEDLSPSQQHDWYNIGRIIFSWCCCTSKFKL